MRATQVLTDLLTTAPGRVPTVYGALEEWLLDRQALRNLSPVTVAWYRARLQPLLALVGPDATLDTLSVEHVRRMQVASRARGNGSQTVKDDYGAIRAFTRWCARQGWPVDGRLLVMEPPIVEDHSRIEIFTTSDIATMQKAWRGSLRNLLMIGLLLGTGIRLAELAGLRLDDRQYQQLEIRWQSAKGRKTRWVPLSARLQADWVRYCNRQRPDAPGRPELLLTTNGKPLTRRGIQIAFHRLGRQTGIHVYPHRFRHTFATLYVRRSLEQGQPFDPERLRMMLGHRSYALFPTYVALAKSDLVTGWEKVAPY